MKPIITISGSTILSESQRLTELFKWGCDSVEMGSFESESDYRYVLRECRSRRMRLAIHSPFYRDGNRYGLLLDEQVAWVELERDLVVASRDGLAYVLVHFPYSRMPLRCEHIPIIREAAERMHLLSVKYRVPVVIEPKLGPNRDSSGLRLLYDLPLQELESWGLSWCLDVGDMYLASIEANASFLDAIRHLAPLTKSVHLHNIVVKGDQYFWTPITGNDVVPIDKTIDVLQRFDRETYFVLEHTPHLVESERQVQQGIEWLRKEVMR